MFNFPFIFRFLLRLAIAGPWRMAFLIWIGILLAIAAALDGHWILSVLSVAVFTTLGVYWNQRAQRSI